MSTIHTPPSRWLIKKKKWARNIEGISLTLILITIFDLFSALLYYNSCTVTSYNKGLQEKYCELAIMNGALGGGFMTLAIILLCTRCCCLPSFEGDFRWTFRYCASAKFFLSFYFAIQILVLWLLGYPYDHEKFWCLFFLSFWLLFTIIGLVGKKMRWGSIDIGGLCTISFTTPITDEDGIIDPVVLDDLSSTTTT